MKQGDPFISLEQYLLATEAWSDSKCDPRSAWRVMMRAEKWPVLYALSKASYEKFGLNGPSAGTCVMTLQNGHCSSSGGSQRVVVGDYLENPRYIELCVAFKKSEGDRWTSIVERAAWWTEIVELPEDFDSNWRKYDQLFNGS